MDVNPDFGTKNDFQDEKKETPCKNGQCQECYNKLTFAFNSFYPLRVYKTNEFHQSVLLSIACYFLEFDQKIQGLLFNLWLLCNLALS